MTKRFKTTLFLFSIVVFLLLSYFVVLYAQGFRFDFRKFEFVESGGLLVKANVDKAQILLNDRISGRTSLISNGFSENNILPGEYSLRIEKTGHLALRKNIEIKSGEVFQLTRLYLATEDELINFVNQVSVSKANEPPIPYFISKRDRLLYRQEEGKAPEKLSTDKVLIEDFKLRLIEEEIYLVSANPKAAGVFILNEGKWENIFNAPAQDIMMSEDRGKMAFVGQNEIRVLWFRDDDGAPYFKKDHEELVLRISQRIKEAFWFKTSWHLIYITELDEVHFVELDPTGGRNDLVI